MGKWCATCASDTPEADQRICAAWHALDVAVQRVAATLDRKTLLFLAKSSPEAWFRGVMYDEARARRLARRYGGR